MMRPGHPSGHPGGHAEHPSVIMFKAELEKNPPKEHSDSKLISADEIFKHNSIEDAWVSHRGKVYNVTQYLKFHPSGLSCFGEYLGYDISSVTAAVHPRVNIFQTIEKLQVGVLSTDPKEKPTNTRRKSPERGQL
ncbi:Ferrihemoglobin reductase [Spironucleus salmonicida]|uniref:Cytochrome b5-like Heme/Steroid binding domain-containing protein n=1 Tax=Spironucleus salmonicida TaxID=348837 RepID=V6LH68_9EUKA|nr:Ferrihemoglobin reductase [Spironucleus salmonicida]|eukprot:EST43882.1 Cytochrome b5-like Heme/Steroid binding domain-containing protein [Spironucleus salmonicida]